MPLTSGFFAKFYVITAAVEAGSTGLAVIAMLTAVVAAFLYLRIIVSMYMSVEDAGEPRAIPVPFAAGLALVIAVGFTLVRRDLPRAALPCVPKTPPRCSSSNPSRPSSPTPPPSPRSGRRRILLQGFAVGERCRDVIVTAAPPNARERATRRSRPLASRAFRPLRGAVPGASWPRCTTFSMAPPSTALPDVELVELARSGDRTAFDELLRRHDVRMRGLAYRLMADRHRMDDALQEAYLKAFKALPRFRAGSDFGTWLYRITYNACIDELRKRKRSPSPRRTRSTPNPAARARSGSSVPSETVRHALATLPDDQRVTVVLVDGEGFDHREAADILGVAPGTVASRLHRARAALRQRARRGGAMSELEVTPDPVVRTALQRLPIPPHEDGFWTRLDEALVDAGASPGPARVRRSQARRRTRGVGRRPAPGAARPRAEPDPAARARAPGLATHVERHLARRRRRRGGGRAPGRGHPHG